LRKDMALGQLQQKQVTGKVQQLQGTVPISSK
jgi:hypothetical protein